MPISSHALLPYVVQELQLTQAKKVLDIGIGNGINGAMVYNYGTTLLNKAPLIYGIEAWEDYRNPLWLVYDDIYTGDLCQFVTHSKFELIIMMDVIEHLELIEGQKQLKRYKDMLSPGGVMIVSTPAIFVPQGIHKGNSYERHLSLWGPGDFKELGFKSMRPPGESLFGEKMLIYKFKNGGQK